MYKEDNAHCIFLVHGAKRKPLTTKYNRFLKGQNLSFSTELVLGNLNKIKEAVNMTFKKKTQQGTEPSQEDLPLFFYYLHALCLLKMKEC